MSDKQVVIDVVQRLPETATLDEISDEIAILAAIRRGEAAANASRTVSHDEVRQRSAAWVRK